MILDGLFDEWTGATTIVDDAPAELEAAVDILSVQGLDDASWLYLAVDVGNEVTLQALPGTLHLLFDTDGDVRTGGTIAGMEGVDLVVDLSQTAEPLVAGRGSGFALRTVAADGTGRPLERYALGLVAAPTWSAPRFELRLSRLGADGASPFGMRFRLKAFYEEGGESLDETEVGSYAFRERPSAPTRHAVSVPTKPVGATRVAQWNVAVDRFATFGAEFARVLAAVDPDVLLLDELPGSITHEQLASFFELEPLRRLGAWEFVLGETGGVQRAAVAARHRAVRPAVRLRNVPYPDGSLAPLISEVADRTRSFLADEVRRGVSVAGAWVDVDGRDVLFLALDLQSGGWAGSLQDRLRALQASIIRRRVLDELAGSSNPLVIAGDLNLVGSRTPLFALTSGLDVDASDLVAVDAMRLGERTYATWRNPRDLFTPGRLDFMFISDASIDVASAFVFAIEDLDDAALAGLGLERDVSRRLSDHLPVVADLLLASNLR